MELLWRGVVRDEERERSSDFSTDIVLSTMGVGLGMVG